MVCALRIGCGNDGMNLIASVIVSMPLSNIVLTCIRRAIVVEFKLLLITVVAV